MVTSSALFQAQAGVQLNGTLLDEVFLLALAPPVCDAPGGDRPRFTQNATWLCVCVAGWSGASCLVPAPTTSSSSPPAAMAADVDALAVQVASLTAQVAALQASTALLLGRVVSPPPSPPLPPLPPLPPAPPPQPPLPPSPPPSSFIAAGTFFTCMASSGGVQCWGSDSTGQLGDDTTTFEQKTVPTSVVGLSSGVVAIAAGDLHACALLATTGGEQCWGYNGHGQLGDGTTTNRLVPTNVVGLSSGVAAITAGAFHTCALLASTGGVKCWGFNSNGQLGDGTLNDGQRVPTNVVGLSSGVVAITAGDSHTCALLMSAGGVQCWGGNGGQLGDGTVTRRLVPTNVVGLSSAVAAITAGNYHTCALLTSSGGVHCWGGNGGGQLGDGTKIDRLVPISVVGLSSGVAAITAGAAHTCALLASTGGVQCWGNNGLGQLGDGMTTAWLVPTTSVAGLSSSVAAITAGSGHNCAQLMSGDMLCWGDNRYGQIGDGTTTQRLVPTSRYIGPGAPGGR
jgi:alpha-tubulin suppressor-like RCC1 family protein